MNETDKLGRSPLHYVPLDVEPAQQKAEVARLINAGCDVNLKDRNGWVPLHFAAQEGAIAVAKALLDAGADVDATGKKEGSSLHS